MIREWLERHPKLVAWVDARIERAEIRRNVANRPIGWDAEHMGRMTGRNAFGDFFTIGFSQPQPWRPQARWVLSICPHCPDGRRACQEHWLYDYFETTEHGGLLACQVAADRWTMKTYPIAAAVGG